MTEVQQNITTQPVEQAQQQNIAETQPEKKTLPHEHEQQPEKNDESTNPDWRAFREGRRKDRLEKEAAQRRALEKEAEIAALKAAMEAAFSKNAPSPQAYQNYYGTAGEESEDDKIEKKVNELLAKKEAEYTRQQQEREQREMPVKLNRDYPDFNQVCSQENIDYLDFHFPEISNALNQLPENYEKWSSIYRTVKKLIPNAANAKKESERAQINTNKPKSISSPTVTPQGQPVRESWQESEQRRAANWERMQRIMKGV